MSIDRFMLRENSTELRRSLPFGGTCPENETCTLSRVSVTLDEGLGGAVLHAVRHSSLPAVAGAALLLLVRKYSGTGRWSLGVLHAATDRLGVRPLSCEVSGDHHLSEHLEAVTAALREPAFPPQEPYQVVLATDADSPARAYASPGGPRFDLALTAEHRAGRVLVHLDHHRHVYDDAFARRAAAHLLRALDALTRTPRRRIREADLLTENERQEILGRFNDTRTEYPRDATLSGLFTEQVEEGPDRIAVVHGQTTLTYRVLQERVLALAAVLRRRGVRRGDRVAFMLGKVPEMVVATLAILRAGATYVPIDPEYPVDRRRFLLADSGSRLLLTTGPAPGLAIDTIDLGALAATPQDVPSQDGGPGVTAEDGAYVMYTSGTTGQPKGVLISHRAVIRLVRNTGFVPLSADTRILQTGAVVFDATTFELWGTLLNGGTLVLAPDHTILDAATLRAAIAAHGVNTMWLTAPLFHQLVDQDAGVFAAPLRHLLVGGDVLSARHLAKALDACPDLRLINGYGPTENTTFSTTHPIPRGLTGSVPIGRPIANSTAYVLDLDGALQPVGVPGELYVGGDGVGEGYLNQPELTRKAFVPDPFTPGGRLYRTGDRARWLPDGTIEFLGRRDGQVKISGFRVEPGEVEERLLRLPGIRQAAVLVRTRAEGVEKYLCAYFTADHQPAARELRNALRRDLPVHMVPSAFVRLDAMPLNRNGKVDRAALAAMDHPRTPAAPEAADEVERQVAESWSRALGLPRLEVTENLFDVGVTSLDAARLAASVRDDFGTRLTVADVLANPTVRAVAALVRAAGTAGAPPVIAPAPRRPLYPLTAQQRGIHIDQQKDVKATHYNVPVLIDVPGRVDPARLSDALAQVVARHDSLRTSFVPVGTEIFQRVHAEAPPLLESLPTAADAEAFARPFDLAAPPLMRAGLFRGEDTSRIVLDFHHLAVDGVTLRILLDEIETAYNGGPLPEPALQYPDYAVWQSGDDGARRRAEQERFWSRTFPAIEPLPDLPTDLPRPAVRSTAGARVRFTIGAPHTDLLRAFSRDASVTLFHTLLAVHFLFLARVTGRHDLRVGTPVAGRTAPELERVAGLFANTVCLRATAAPDLSFTDFARAVGRHAVEAFVHQDYPFDRLAERAAPARDYARNPLFDTMIALQDTGLHGREFLGGRVSVADTASTFSMFDLNLQLYSNGRSLDAVWAYSTALFRPETVRSFQSDLLELMDAAIAAPGRPIGELISVTTATHAPMIEFDFSQGA